MSEVLKLMQTRRSIRKFKSDMVPKELIEKVVEAGTFAASGMNRQPFALIAVTNKELRDKLSFYNAG
jgi:nitroreductase